MSFTFDEIYNLRCGLRLNSGINLTLCSLQQHLTYGDLLEGRPSRETNDDEIAWIRARESQDGQPYVIPPRRVNMPGDMEAHSRTGRMAEWLPAVCCIARFMHAAPVHDPDEHVSELTVIWYQNEFALPIDPSILDAIRNLDWKNLAHDFSY